METLSFNTGRLYTAHGQRIRAASDGETIYFTDADRLIAGMIPADACRFSPRAIMRAYDRGDYADTLHMITPAIAPLAEAIDALELVSVSAAMRI